ncbi:hypothetical protein KFE25_000268 [Diacronema lutheri]|uniref:Uncharacterized protein n=1 Tax=Diacronema lutheri TaxID=2081491 RepID=A0A8J5XIV3_DIALT|nr:hypothetical protein KFE25_000268 [Diacronema lutheri]
MADKRKPPTSIHSRPADVIGPREKRRKQPLAPHACSSDEGPSAKRPEQLAAACTTGAALVPALHARAVDAGASDQPPGGRQPKHLAALHTKGAVLTPALHARPFDADPTDHCETPFKAYRDIEPFLFRLALSLGRSKSTLRIYDPYFCEGSAVKHLAQLGFESVYNRNEDFYAQVAGGAVPEHDVVVTNPPFSADHIERALRFCVAQNDGRPWFLLLPNFIYKKRTCAPELALAPSPPLFLVPASTYTFWSPGRQFRTGPAREKPPVGADGAAAGKPTTPFECMWYLWCGSAKAHAELQQWWLKKYEKASGCALALSPDELPDKVKPKRTEKRPNPKARKRMRAKGIPV